MFTYKKLTSLLLFAFFIFTAYAQNTDSHYSRYGYGVLKDNSVGVSKGMGGVSYGIRGESVNPGNPASFSSVDSLTFLFDISISYTQSRFSAPNGVQTDENGGLDYLVMQFPLSKRLGFSAGILPYSAVGYAFGSYETDNNDLGTRYYYSGTGGLNTVYGGLSYDITRQLSFGAKISYLFGSVSHGGSTSLTESGSSTTTKSYKLKVNGTKLDFGLQYQLPLANNKTLALGVVYSPEVKPAARANEEILEITANSSSYTYDTVFSRLSQKVDSRLPHTFGAGFTFSDNKKFTYGADITFEKWSGLAFPSEMGDDLSASDRFNNRWRINAGAEYIIAPYERSFFKRIRFRGGLNYSNSYMNVTEKSTGEIGGFKEYGASLGMGLPFRDYFTGRTTLINLNFEYKRIAPEIKSMIKENYFTVSLGITLNDLWFMKSKFR